MIPRELQCKRIKSQLILLATSVVYIMPVILAISINLTKRNKIEIRYI